MKKRYGSGGVMLVVALMVFGSSAWARDTQRDFPIEDGLAQPDAKAKITIPLYFGAQKPGKKVVQTLGEYSTSKKTNAFGKSDETACNWAFLSALLTLQSRAHNEGGNAIINIKSNYRGDETSSETTYQCGAGNIMAGVALKGTVVKLSD